MGRGSLAGPVFVAAVAIPQGFKIHATRDKKKMRDSKQLTPKAREAWFRYVRDTKVPYAVRRISPRQIDRMNISRAANLAAERAYLALSKPRMHRIFLDGGLFLGAKGKYSQARTVVRGDERIPAIALASIVAKVLRDRYMVHLAKKYPRYGFEVHKGYGTRAHREAITRHGPSKAHRLTFIA